MKHIKLNVSEQDWENLKQIAQDHETKANRILEKIIFDLTCSIESGGSDERDFAALWLSRSRYNLEGDGLWKEYSTMISDNGR